MKSIQLGLSQLREWFCCVANSFVPGHNPFGQAVSAQASAAQPAEGNGSTVMSSGLNMVFMSAAQPLVVQYQLSVMAAQPLVVGQAAMASLATGRELQAVMAQPLLVAQATAAQLQASCCRQAAARCCFAAAGG